DSSGIPLAPEGGDADDPHRRRRAARGRSRPLHARRWAHQREGRVRRRDGARAGRSAAPRPDLSRRAPTGHQRVRGLRQAPPKPALRPPQDRHADGRRAGVRRRAWSQRRRESLPDQALLAGAAHLARRERGAACPRMAARIAARSRERTAAGSGDELTVAYRRLNAAYQQTLRYAEDVRRLYQQLQRAIHQSLLGLANALEAKYDYTKGHSERVGAWSRGVAAALGLPAADV